MKHRVAGRKLGRTGEHRLAVLRNLSTALFDKEKIRTTLAKAKELRPFAERLVTLSKRETLHARRMVLRHIHDRRVVGKLFDSLSARFAQRPGGYTRIIKLGPRRGDSAEMAIIELVGAEDAATSDATQGKAAAPAKGRGKKSTRAKKAPEAEAGSATEAGESTRAAKATARKKAAKKKAAKAGPAGGAKKKAKAPAKKRGSSKSGGER